MRLGALALVVADYDGAIGWYCGKLGFSLIEDSPRGGGKRWVTLSAGGVRLVLAKAAGPAQEARIGDQTGGRVFLFLETDDFDRDHALLSARGVRFLETPRTEDYGKVAVFEDLYGNRWDLLQPVANSDASVS
jgi:catechol 2,3-dioxygenase-like lactoylglutathione lyase family enzyme